MRLKTRRIIVDVFLEDRSSIKVQELKKSEISCILDPCKDLFSQRDNGPEERFNRLLEEMSDKQDFELLVKFGESFKNFFRRMVIGWSDIQDEEGIDLEFSSENKEKIIEYDEDGFIYKFVIKAISKINEEKEKISKNCKAGLTGNSAPVEPAVNNAESEGLKVAETVTVQDGLIVETNTP